jgi:hypothetical protein
MPNKVKTGKERELAEAKLRPCVSAPRARMARRPPSQSSSPVSVSFRLSGTWVSVSQVTAHAIGKLIQKAARQLKLSINRPPRGGPSAVVIAEAAAQRPIARPRTVFGKEAAMMARLCGIMSAAPTPCTRRAPMSIVRLGAKAQAAEANVKIAMPIRKTRRRP